MKNWKTWQIVLFTALCICLNVGGRMASVALELPLWADSFGTALCAYAGGPVCGAMVGRWQRVWHTARSIPSRPHTPSPPYPSA